METSTIAGLATDMASTKVQQTAEIAVLKKAIDLQAEGALQLLQAVAPLPTLSTSGGTAGAVINVKA
ncbi:MAG: YjfB family protein [Gammaproteobacteria bacterium]